MRLWVDDEREAPPGWVRAHTYGQAIGYLRLRFVSEISLDHDLGEDKTGYDVLNTIEKWVVTEGYRPPTIHVHSANPVGRENMERAIASIERRRKDVPLSQQDTQEAQVPSLDNDESALPDGAGTGE